MKSLFGPPTPSILFNIDTFCLELWLRSVGVVMDEVAGLRK